MCGIAGYFLIEPEKAPHKGELFLEKASAKLVHRGPDGFGIWKNERAGLLHRRLNIMDLGETGHQPYSLEDSHLVFNGEIYNYLDLAKKYGFPGVPPNDTYVLHHLFKKRKIAGLAELDGMFAAAVFDESSQTLTLFRDVNGIKPLLYYWDGRSLVFASEMKAVLEWGFDKKLRQQGLLQYLFYEFIPGRETIFENVFKLLPGQVLEINPSGLKTSFFADPIPMNPQKSKHELSDFNTSFEASVQSQLSAQVPLGAFFSGGADSTGVVWKTTDAISKHRGQKKLQTFTITFDQPDFDESHYAKEIGRLLPVETHFHQVNSKDIVSLVEQLPEFYDEPFAVPSVIPTLELCRVASQNLRVALCGDGGDERLLGYGSYLLAQKVIPYQPFFPLVHTLLRYGTSLRYQRAARYFAPADGVERLAHLWSQSQDMFMLSEIKGLMTELPPYASEEINQFWKQVADKVTASEKILPAIGSRERALRELNIFDQLFYFPSDLMYKTDIASMAHSLEVRVPFMSCHLQDWNVAVNPLAGYLHQKELKYPLKQLLLTRFPKELVLRPKWGFPAPMGKWLQGDLAYLIDKYLNPAFLRSQGIFQPQTVTDLVHAFKHGKIYHYKRLWTLIAFQMWYNKYC